MGRRDDVLQMISVDSSRTRQSSYSSCDTVSCRGRDDERAETLEHNANTGDYWRDDGRMTRH